MSVCTFFGHSDCYGLHAGTLQRAIEDLILQGVESFYVGNQGQFDAMARTSLKLLQKKYPYIRYSVVLAYLPTSKGEYEDLSDAMYPEIEGCPKFAIERRNQWMLKQADYCLCYVNHTWGGAYKFSCMAKRRGLTVINLGTIAI